MLHTSKPQVKSIKTKVKSLLDTGESFKLRLATDSEYKQRVNGNNLYIGYSIQEWTMDYSGPKTWIEHPDFRRQRPKLKGERYPDAIIGTDLAFDLFLPDNHKINIDTGMVVIKKDERPIMEIECGLYFAPADLMCLFPKQHRHSIVTQLEQNGAIANVEGKPIWIGTLNYGDVQWRVALKVLDIAKEGPPGGLKKLAEGVGEPMDDKDSMDEYKSDMTIPYMSPTMIHKFVKYALADTIIIPKVHKKHQGRFISLGEAIGLTNLKPTREYRSMGSMVSDLTLLKLKDHCALDDGSYPWERFKKRSGLGGKQVSWDLPDLLKFASVKYLAGKTSTDKTMLAIVNGGLAKNMKPLVQSIKGIIPDWDVSGAYATCQKHIDYCIGIPHTYGLHEHSKAKPIKLGEFLTKHEGQLINRKWVISVSGRLTHTQTLVPSKEVTKVQINNYSENDSAHIPGDFNVLRNEIQNGIITSDILNIITAICNRRELNEWMSLTVVAAAWYPKSHMCNSPQEWADKIAECGNSVEETTDKKGNTIISDTRSKHWYYMPLAEIISKWSDKRDEYKTKKKQATTPEESKYYDGLQNAMKLGNNTNYGVQASPLFPIGNVVTANNITALCRSIVWSSVMAANGTQVITDGFCYDINNVRKVKPSFEKYRMGMNTLCVEMFDPKQLGKNERNQFEYGSLGGEVWSELTCVETNSKKEEVVSYRRGGEVITCVEEGHTLVDTLFTEHVKEFWKGLTGQELDCFDILRSAHKHIYKEAYFHSQTNYSFKTIGGKTKIKARGHQLSKDHQDLTNDEMTSSPYKKFIEDLATNPHAVPLPKPCTIPTVLKINAYNNMGSKSDMSKFWGIEAGDSIEKTVFIRPLSLSPFFFYDFKQRESWTKRNDRLKQTTGWGLERFFLNQDGTLDYVKAMETIHNKISKGDMWIHDVTAHDDKVNHPYLVAAQHPKFCRIN